MEGPQFSTRAESHLYRAWGAHVIGMTNLQEAKLAREAEICFATLALATDYDCWNESAGDVEIEHVLTVLKNNVDLAQRTIRRAVAKLSAPRVLRLCVGVKGCYHYGTRAHSQETPRAIYGRSSGNIYERFSRRHRCF